MPNSPTFTGAGTPLGQLRHALFCRSKTIWPRSGRHFLNVAHGCPDSSRPARQRLSFSQLRPKGRVTPARVWPPDRSASCEYMTRPFGEIAQGGTRRGPTWPPCASITLTSWSSSAARVRRRHRQLNVSVGITDEFMRAVEADGEYDLINPRRQCMETTTARQIFGEIVSTPPQRRAGALFLDTANRSNPCRTCTNWKQPTPVASSGSGLRELLLGRSTWRACRLDGDVDWPKVRRRSRWRPLPRQRGGC